MRLNYTMLFVHDDFEKVGVAHASDTLYGYYRLWVYYLLARVLRRPLYRSDYVINKNMQGWPKELLGTTQHVRVVKYYVRDLQWEQIPARHMRKAEELAWGMYE